MMSPEPDEVAEMPAELKSSAATAVETEIPTTAQRDIEHFIHRPGSRPAVAMGTGGETLREVLVRLEVIADRSDDVYVFYQSPRMLTHLRFPNRRGG